MPAGDAPQPTGADPRGRPRTHSPGAGRRPRAALRGLRGLRDRRAPRPRARGGGRRPAGGRPLLRGVRRPGGLRDARRGRAGHVLPDRLPRPELRAARHPRPRARSPPGAAAALLRQLPAGASTSPRRTTRFWTRRLAAAPSPRPSIRAPLHRPRGARPGTRAAWRRGRRRPRRRLSQEPPDGRLADRDLVARHPRPGHRRRIVASPTRWSSTRASRSRSTRRR